MTQSDFQSPPSGFRTHTNVRSSVITKTAGTNLVRAKARNMRGIHHIAGLLFLSWLVGCSSGGAGGITLKVENGRKPAALMKSATLPDVLVANSFRVVISGADFAPPIEVSFAGDTTKGTISGIPIGADRTVLIEAINSNGQVIRKREMRGISIEGGGPTAVQATLLSIPWVTNIKDGSVIPLNRLMFLGYGEPAGSVEVMDQFEGVSASLSDITTAQPSVSPSRSDGSFFFRPQTLSPGKHTFEFRDPQTKESSKLTVTLVTVHRVPGTFVEFGGAVSSQATINLGINEGQSAQGETP